MPRHDLVDGGLADIVALVSDGLAGLEQEYFLFRVVVVKGKVVGYAPATATDNREVMKAYDRRNRVVSEFNPAGGHAYLDGVYDVGYPEITTPECINARDVALHSAANDQDMVLATEDVNQSRDKTSQQVRVFKVGTGADGASRGCHENYQIGDVETFNVMRRMRAFFRLRGILTESGGVVPDPAQDSGWSLSRVQRGWMIQNSNLVHKPPENHGYVRMEYSGHGPNFGDLDNLFKVGLTRLVLRQCEREIDAEKGRAQRSSILWVNDDPRRHALWHRIQDNSPLPSLPASRAGTNLTMTPLDVMDHYREKVENTFTASELSAEEKLVIKIWDHRSACLRADITGAGSGIEWAAKAKVFRRANEEALSKNGRPLTHGQAVKIDSRFSAVPDRRVEKHFYRASAMFSLAELQRASVTPPSNTAAAVRGRLVSHFYASGEDPWISWDHITTMSGRCVDFGDGRSPVLDPQSQATVDELLGATLETGHHRQADRDTGLSM